MSRGGRHRVPDFVLELLTEEIPARMQPRAAAQLRERFETGIAGQLPCDRVEAAVTPRRLILFARGLAAEGDATEEERRGPRADAPAQALEGFLRSTGLTRDQLEERETPKGRFLYAVLRAAGRPAADVLSELIPQIVRDFDWPKSMRWGAASTSTASPRWVRPLSGIVALLGDTIVPFEAAGVTSGRTTRGHRFMHRAPVEIASAATYAEQLRAAYVLIDPAERTSLIAEGARAAAAAAGLTLIDDAGLIAENAGLTEWPVPLLGRFDPAFLDVPREVIQLTMRTNQKYFACTDGQGALAPAFVCIAGLAAPDGGAAIVAGNEKVLSARLSDAKFFWDQDRATTLEARLPKLADIVFHEKLGTVADKVERVAKLARWLVESGAVRSSPLPPGEGRETRPLARPGGGNDATRSPAASLPPPNPLPEGEGESARARLATLAEQAARLCKADLVSATVGEFPEVQGIAGRYLALAEGLPPEVADAIRDHYKPVGPSDTVPTAPVSVAVALADKIDTLLGFFGNGLKPTGSRDPFALRRAGLGVISLIVENDLKESLIELFQDHSSEFYEEIRVLSLPWYRLNLVVEALRDGDKNYNVVEDGADLWMVHAENRVALLRKSEFTDPIASEEQVGRALEGMFDLVEFLIERLKVQQQRAGIRPDVIEAVFSLREEDNLVRLLARVRALQAFIGTDDGVNLLAGYRRAANILRIEEAKDGPHDGAPDPSRLSDPSEHALAAALDATLARAAAAVAAEDFEGAMTALSTLRAPVDAFFAAVMVNDPDSAVRANRLALLARFRAAVHTVAEFSKIEG